MPDRKTKKPAKAVRKPTVKKKPAAELDLSAFPPESITRQEKYVCLACVLDVFTRHMGLSPKAAQLEVKRYSPSLAEVNAATLPRPYFVPETPQDACPYCGAAAKWHARLPIYRIESGKATDVLRRGLVKSLPQSSGQFAFLEEKATQQHAFYDWLNKVSAGLDLDNDRWLGEVSKHYLGRKEPKVNWEEPFVKIHSIRRSRRLETGWEVDGDRLFLAPFLFDELLLVQYLVSRSHKSGGLTLEGRYTLPELFHRLRTSGYLRSVGVVSQDSGDALEQLVEYLGGGEGALKFYFIVDRRDLLAKAKAVAAMRLPRPKKS